MRMANYLAGYHKRLIALAVALPLLALLALSTPAQAAPVVILTPATGAVGTKVTITGTVFDSYKGDNVHIFFDSTEINNSPTEVHDTGTFTTDFIIPAEASPGNHWVRVRSEVGSTSFLAETSFAVEETRISLDVGDGPVGTSVTVSGRGFYAGRVVTIYYHNLTIVEKIGTTSASATGQFTYQFAIPLSTAGEHKIVVSNAEGNSAESSFNIIPSIRLNLTSGGAGDLLTVSGTGFGYRCNVGIYFGIYPLASVIADGNGTFEITFNIPGVKPDSYDVKAQDQLGNMDKMKFTITAGASLDKDTGPVGTPVTINGSGFQPDGTVAISYDDLPPAEIATDNNGAFTIVLSIPPSRSGAHTITISDGVTTRQLVFTVESEAPPAPGLLLPADGTETRATAYLDWQDVTDPSLPVTYSLQVAVDRNFSSIVLEKVGLDVSQYTFSEDERLTAVMQESRYYWRVKATDSAGNQGEWSAPWSFYVSTPPAPPLILPASESQADMPVFFDWQDVTSLSPPVTYSLQVAKDPNFTNIVLEKVGLDVSQYTLPEEDKLPAVKQESPYYWRVKASDSAGNQGEWSAPWSFYTGFSFTMPGWAIYTLIGILVVGVGFLAFLLGRRTAFSTSY